MRFGFMLLVLISYFCKYCRFGNIFVWFCEKNCVLYKSKIFLIKVFFFKLFKISFEYKCILFKGWFKWNYLILKFDFDWFWEKLFGVWYLLFKCVGVC